MINIYLKKQLGATTFIITSVLVLLLTLLIVFAAAHNIMQQKTVANEYRSMKAFSAAEAGLEYGIEYFRVNSATILASTSGGYLSSFTNSNVTNVSLPDNSTFSVNFSNPVANNYTRILVTSTGTSADGTATRTITQQINFGSVLVQAPSVPLISKGSVALSGSGVIQNTSTNTTIQSALGVTLSGSSSTVLQSGTSSTASTLKSDVQQNNTSLANMSQNDLFATYFGGSAAQLKSSFVHYFSNGSDTNYSSSLNGMTGTSVWIDQTGGSAAINGNTTIGSSANPVLLVVNGNLSISGNVTIYGLIYVIGNSGLNTSFGNITIYGALMTTSNLTISGSSSLIYNPSLLANLRSQSGISYYAKIPGTWKDF